MSDSKRGELFTCADKLIFVLLVIYFYVPHLIKFKRLMLGLMLLSKNWQVVVAWYLAAAW